MAEKVDLNRMVDHQIDRHQRIDFVGITAEPLHGASHRCQIDHAGHSRKVLQDHAGRFERNFCSRRRRRIPASQIGYIALRNGVAIAVSQH